MSEIKSIELLNTQDIIYLKSIKRKPVLKLQPFSVDKDIVIRILFPYTTEQLDDSSMIILTNEDNNNRIVINLVTKECIVSKTLQDSDIFEKTTTSIVETTIVKKYDEDYSYVDITILKTFRKSVSELLSVSDIGKLFKTEINLKIKETQGDIIYNSNTLETPIYVMFDLDYSLIQSPHIYITFDEKDKMIVYN